MSKIPMRTGSTIFRAAGWLPFLLMLADTGALSARAQTSGNAPPMGGDCTVGAASSITCTRTKGAAFASSATVDTTNAANISTGVLGSSRLPAATAASAGSVQLDPSATTSVLSPMATGSALPSYFYAGPGWGQAQAVQAVSSPAQMSATPAPTHVVLFADSKIGYMASNYLLRLDSQVQRLNGLGSMSFFSMAGASGASLPSASTGSSTGGSYNGLASLTLSQSCSFNRNVTANVYDFGPSGSYMECPTGTTITYTPSLLFPFDEFTVTYRIASGGGSFTYAANGTALGTANASGTESFGYLDVNSGFTRAAANAVTLVTTGTVRFYTIGSWQKAQSGLVVHVLNSGGSKLQDWAAQPGYAAAYVAAVKPALVEANLDTNDAGAGNSAATFSANLNTFMSGLNLSSLTVPPDTLWVSSYDRGYVSGSTCAADTSANALLDGYRTALFAAQPTWGFAVLDMRGGVPAFPKLFADGDVLASDCIHPSSAGASYFTAKMVAPLQTLLREPLQESINPAPRKQSTLLVPRSGANIGVAVAQSQSSGGLIDSGTGMYTDGTFFGDLLFRLLGTTYDRFGQPAGNYNANMNPSGASTYPYTLGGVIHTLYPDSSYPCPLYSYRLGSSANTAWSLCGNSSDNNWDFDLWNVGLTVSNQGRAWMNLTSLNRQVFSSDATLGWTGSASTVTAAGGGSRGTVDTQLSRSAAGIVSVDTGTQGNAAGSVATSGLLPGTVTVTANTTLTAFQYTVLCNASAGSVTINLPATVTRSYFNVKKIDGSANTCTVSGNGHNIDGSAATSLSAQYAVQRVQGDGTQWWGL